MLFKSRKFLFLLIACLVACHHTKPVTENKVVPPVPKKEGAPLSHFSEIASCSPVLEWNAVSIPNVPLVSYDVAVYEAEKIDSNYFDKTTQILYKENYPVTSLGIIPPLKPQTKYLWSIRVRQHKIDTSTSEDKVSQWSTNSKTVKRPLAVATYIDHWHGFITPEKCETL